MRPSAPIVLAAKVFALGFIGITVYCAVVYLLLRDVVGLHMVFGGLYRMFMYHAKHPFQNIALFCAVFAAGLALILGAWPTAKRWPAWVLTTLVLLLTVLLGSALGGALWALHDMQAGYFPPGDRRWQQMKWACKVAWKWAGWCCCSLPFNVLCLPAFYAAGRYGSRQFHRLKPEPPAP
jgi:hypothetical protein